MALLKQAVITGASAGIGHATAKLFAAEGWKVLNLSRRPCDAEGVQDLLGDLSERAHTDEFAEELADVVADVDILCLIHNAARLEKDSTIDIDHRRFEAVMRMNISVPSSINRILIPLMREGSSTLYVGSTLSEQAVPGAFSYVVSKHALLGMMRATCQDLANQGIHTACICPGFTDTDMLRTHLGNDPETMQAVADMSAFNRLVKPEEIASTLFFAANTPAINGSVLHVNLGQVGK